MSRKYLVALTTVGFFAIKDKIVRDHAARVAQALLHDRIQVFGRYLENTGSFAAERHQLHIYDANIWAAAILAGCDRLYSEGKHHGLTIEGVTLRDPFAA